MKHRAMKTILSALLLGSSLYQGCYAQVWNSSSLASQCQKLSGQLRDLAQINPKGYCTGDIESIANTLEQTSQELFNKEPERILATMKYAALELNEIKNNRTYCASFASLINPILQEVEHTGRVLEGTVPNYLTT